MESITVPKGTVVFVPIQAANINPEVWGPDAHEWRPERWLEPLPESVAAAKTPGVYSNMYVSCNLTGQREGYPRTRADFARNSG